MSVKFLLAVVLIAGGAVLFFQGVNRKDSLVGRASDAGTKIANSLDGGARTPRHVVYMVAGGLLVVVGIGIATRRGSVS